MKDLLFRGTCTALVTPMTDQMKINTERLTELIAVQYFAGIRAIVVCGTTGESAALSDKERIKLWKNAVRAAPKDMVVIAGTGSNNTEHAIQMSKAAEKIGADGLLIVTPYYNKTTQQGLIDHYRRIAQSVNLPIIVYNVPSRTGMDITLDTCKALAEIPNIIGMKDASGDIAQAARIIQSCGDDFYIWSGNDDQIVPMMSVGAKGVISVLSNLCPSETVSITNACQKGNYEKAAILQRSYLDLIDALFCEVNPIPIKAAMNELGMNIGGVRPPLCELSANGKQRLFSALRAHKLR